MLQGSYLTSLRCLFPGKACSVLPPSAPCQAVPASDKCVLVQVWSATDQDWTCKIDEVLILSPLVSTVLSSAGCRHQSFRRHPCFALLSSCLSGMLHCAGPRRH